MTRETPISLWDATAKESDVSGTLEDGRHVDVAIVGGGFTGLSTALHCAQKGLTAQVIEAEHVGFGGSGRNVGLVNAAAWMPPGEIVKKLGDTFGPRFVERFSGGPKYVFDLIEKHQIQCEVTKTGTIHAAHNASGLRNLRERHAQWQKLGEPVDLIDRETVEKMAGTPVFHGGLLDHRAGTINPMGYCRGLARAALGAGAEIATGVRVTKLDKAGEVWHVKTEHGTITADNVVLGTNAYTDDLWPELKRVFSIIHYLQFATKPMGSEAAHILPGRQGLWDTGAVMTNFRRDDRNRLLIGTMGRIIGTREQGFTHRLARKRIARAFPDLGPVEFEEAWHGKIAMTPDHLPRVHQLDRGLWTAIGYNGRGIITGTLFGQSMSELFTGMDPADLPLPVSDMTSVRRGALKAKFFDLAFSATQIWRGIR